MVTDSHPYPRPPRASAQSTRIVLITENIFGSWVVIRLFVALSMKRCRSAQAIWNGYKGELGSFTFQYQDSISNLWVAFEVRQMATVSAWS